MLHALARNIAAAPTFEVAADLALRSALEIAERALASSPYAKKGRILRAMIHLRPDDGYVRLVTLDAGKGEHAGCRVGADAYAPSNTVWKWLSKRRAAVAMDVSLEAVTLFENGAPGEMAGEPLDLGGSRVKLESRDVTHLFGVPLRAAGGRVEGMIVVEAACDDAIGKPFVWASCAGDLETMATLATPFLSKLPVSEISPTTPDKLLPIIGASMLGLVEMVRVFAQQDETILLSGPTGAGKSRLARWCHGRSLRAAEEFVELDLSTLPDELQLAHLFGWQRGAFTSAAKDTIGAVTRAERGTLFIDEIDKLSLASQAGLLSLLENKRYRPLGAGDSDRIANVRYVIGTNANLQDLVQKGRFREDLYYRINVLPVRLPPLRDRADEIIPWARFMLRRRHLEGGGTGEPELGADAAQLLVRQDWPGNLRQLDNIVRRAYVLSLVDVGGAVNKVRIGYDHLGRALRYEMLPGNRGVFDILELAAEAFVVAGVELGPGSALHMDHAEAFKGLVIHAAKRRFPGEENEAIRQAFVLLGRKDTVEKRNHLSMYRREAEKVDALRRALSGAPEPPAEGPA